jgi:uncharacterized protein YggE
VNVPTITVNGHGEFSAKPDRAVLALGAVSQSDHAASAQSAVNQIVRKTLEKLKALNIPETAIRTSGLSLTPVYSYDGAASRSEREPRITGFRASNTVEVELDDLQRVGEAIDARRHPELDGHPAVQPAGNRRQSDGRQQ